VRRATSAGLLPEQVHPFTGAPMAVTPLTWSHAALVTAACDYLERRAAVSACPMCGSTVSSLQRLRLERAMR
jgi:hypothetical protein